MNLKQLTETIAEANRFIKRAETLRDYHLNMHLGRDVPHGLYQNPREQGAVRRASMDLTRALADLRKPN